VPDYPVSVIERIGRHCAAFEMFPTRRLGFGKDGAVWATNRATAVKAHERRRTYERERDVYARLASHHTGAVAGHAVPFVLRLDDEAGTIEMTIVRPPFVLDFASARLDHPIDFPEDVLADWFVEKREQFGNDWPRAAAVIRGLERMGIFMTDVHPGNIRSR
jgi:hypothetical protein